MLTLGAPVMAPGTHVGSTAEIQIIKIIAVEKNRGAVRLRFASGSRVLGALGRSLTREAKLTARLSCPPAEHDGAVDALQVGWWSLMDGLTILLLDSR